MGNDLHLFLARARASELRAAARAAGVPPERAAEIPAAAALTLRFAFPDDAPSIARLAVLDSSEPPAMPALLAEVEGELRAALSLRDGAVVADPFHPTVAVVELLRARERQLTDLGSAPARPLRSIRAAFRARLRLQSGR